METAEKVKAIICDWLKVDPEKVSDESRFVEDLGADSLDEVELVMEFEDNFGINIDDEEAENVKTVGQAIALIEKALAERSTG